MSKTPYRGASRRRLVLIRHGEVASEWRARIYGRLDVPLSENGRAQLRTVATRFSEARFEQIVSSGLARAEYGAGLLRASRGLDRQDDQDLLEIDRGAWAGRSFEDLERDEPGAFAAWLERPSTRRPPGGESLEEVRERVVAALRRLTEAATGNVAVVAHSWVVRVTACHVLGLSLDRAPDLALPTGGTLIIDHAAHRPFDSTHGRDVQFCGWNSDHVVADRL